MRGGSRSFYERIYIAILDRMAVFMYAKGGDSSHTRRTPNLISERSQQMAYDPNQQYQQPPQYQQPGYQQPGYQQPGYPPPGYQQPVAQSPMTQQLGTTSIGLEPNIAGAISYFWVVGLIFFIIEKKNRFVRFHAFQALAWGIALVVAGIVLDVLDNFFFAFGLIGNLLYLVWLVGAIYSAVQAYNGKWFKLPV